MAGTDKKQNMDPIAKKKKRKKWPFIAGGVALVFLAAILLFPKANRGKALAMATLTATVQKGSITTSVTGTGNLQTGTTNDILLPSGLDVLEVLVESGDHVCAGDTLATFSVASVQSKIAELQSELETLDTKINNTKDDTDSATIKSYLSGRVKKIYAAVDDSVSSCMAENGALLLLSTDGKMAVRIETSAELAAGASVTIELADGSTKTGTVESCSGGVLVATLTDNGPGFGETVTVLDGETALGTGTLYIHQQMEITGQAGTVKGISVSENEKIASGKTLFTLKDMPASTEHQQLLSDRAELVKMLQTLSRIANTGALTAETAGTISSVGLSEGGTSSDSADSSTGTNYSGYTGLSAKPAENNGVALLAAGAAEISDLSGLRIAAPKTGEAMQSSISETAEYAGSISWNPAGTTFQPGIAYRAQISLTAKTGYVFPASIQPTLPGATISGVSVSQESEGNTLCFTATFTATEQQNPPSASPEASAPETASPSLPSGGSNSGTGSFSYSGGSAYSAYSASSSSSTSTTATNSGEVTAFSIASDDSAKLSVEIDELDILSVAVGQKASLTFEAISGETFEGEIAKISDSSSNGSTKYMAEISLARTDSMRIGMSATAIITIEQKEDILVIPVDALQEKGSKVFVYTGVDSEGNLTGETEVTTGLSDGQNAEILTGLSEGDTVYYTQASASGSEFGFMMPGMGGGNSTGNENRGQPPAGEMGGGQKN